MTRPSCLTVTRRRAMQAMAGGAAAAALASCGALRGESDAKARPNIVYLFSDEHRRQAMSFTETPQLRTPHMKRMATEGTAFTHGISNYPVCSPYRAILMSGRWPYQQGVVDNNIPLKAEGPILGRTFRDAGYATGYIGKWHLGGTRAEPFGFDHSLIWTGTNNHWKSAYHPAEGDRTVVTGRYNATVMTDQALAFIERNRRRPFFLAVSWNPPHTNFTDAPEAKKALYPPGSLRPRPNVPATTADDAGAFGWAPRGYLGYHAHVSAIDDEIGRVIKRLEELELAGNTIVVYTSDHGSMLGSHGVGSKRQPFEESIRVPFLVRAPGLVPAGRKVDALFGTIDLFPTLCGLAGISIPPGCMGQDFSPWLRGGNGPEPESQLTMHISKKNASGGDRHPAPLFRGIRTPRYTYAIYPDRPWCLFDNQEDPYQVTNRLADPALASVRRQCETMLRDHLKQAADPLKWPA